MTLNEIQFFKLRVPRGLSWEDVFKLLPILPKFVNDARFWIHHPFWNPFSVTCPFSDHKASVIYGEENEGKAIEQLAIQEHITIQKSRIFSDETHCVEGASPDGLYN